MFDNNNSPSPKSSSPSSNIRMNPDRLKRFQSQLIVSFFSAVLIAIAANFLNFTSFLLSSTSPDYFRSLKLDELYSIEGFRRYEDERSSYQFIFPENWRIDQRLLQRRVQLNETPKELLQAQGINNEALPEIAYGRPDLKFKENLSIIKSQLSPYRKAFLESLQTNDNTREEEKSTRLIDEMYATIGSTLPDIVQPDQDRSIQIADNILSTVIAPEGSGKTYSLLNAQFDNRNEKKYFLFEYNLQKNNAVVPINQHTVSVITIKKDYLYTFTVTSPEGIWETEKEKLYKIAESFTVN